MSDLGLRYGEEFRPIRELSAGAGRSAGKVSLSDGIAHRAGEYQLHPVLFDGALQVFSAGAATVEGRKARLKLPVRFAKILFLHSPGASSLVRAGVQQFSDEFVEGKLCLYDEAGKPCVLVDGFRAISVSGARRSGALRRSRHPLPRLMGAHAGQLAAVSSEASPLSRLQEVAREALEQVIATRGRAKLQASMAACDDLAAAQLARGLREMVSRISRLLTASSLGVAEAMRPIFERLLASLAQRGLLEKTATGYQPTPAFDNAADSAREALRSFISKHSGHLTEGLLCAANCSELGAILRGEKEAVQILFAGAGADLLDQFYGDGLFTSHWLAAIARRCRKPPAICPRAADCASWRLAPARVD